MKNTATEGLDSSRNAQASTELELSDEDIIDAMQHIPGYLDISTEDFRTIYHLAHRHAVERSFAKIRARNLMHLAIPLLSPEMTLDQAAKAIVASRFKGLPVADDSGQVIGMLTETDFLAHLKAKTFLELLLGLIDNSGEFSHRCHDTLVRAAMTAAVVTVKPDAGFWKIMSAFRNHPGRSLPVVDDNNRVCGLLLRKDFLAVFNQDDLL